MKVCSFEVAKILDEKNINILSKDIYALENIAYFPPRHDDEHYAKYGDLIRDFDNCEYLENSGKIGIYAPYLIDILNWLAVNKQIYVSINWVPYNGTSKNKVCTYHIEWTKYIQTFDYEKNIFFSYEDAIEAAVKEILTLLI